MGATKHGVEGPICPTCGADLVESEDGELECFGPNCEGGLILDDDHDDQDED